MPPEAFTLFLDENTCSRKLVEALRTADISVERSTDHFPRGTPDAEWIPLVTSRGWLILTADDRIRYRSNEKIAVQESRARLFVLSAGHLRIEVMIAMVLKALPEMRRVASTHQGPFIRTITKSGTLGKVKL